MVSVVTYPINIFQKFIPRGPSLDPRHSTDTRVVNPCQVRALPGLCAPLVRATQEKYLVGHNLGVRPKG